MVAAGCEGRVVNCRVIETLSEQFHHGPWRGSYSLQ